MSIVATAFYWIHIRKLHRIISICRSTIFQNTGPAINGLMKIEVVGPPSWFGTTLDCKSFDHFTCSGIGHEISCYLYSHSTPTYGSIMAGQRFILQNWERNLYSTTTTLKKYHEKMNLVNFTSWKILIGNHGSF